MGLLADFKTFALKGNVVDLAVAVVIGGAFGKIVSALVADIVMPVVGAILPSGEWRAWQVSPLNIKLGDFLGAILDFMIIAMVLFLIVTRMVHRVFKKEDAPATKDCPECLEKIPLAARRCRACTAPQPQAQSTVA